MATDRTYLEDFETLSPLEQFERNPWLAGHLAYKDRQRARDQNPIPADVRLAVFERAAGQCESCGDETRLELHHRTFYVWDRYGPSDWIFGAETPDDLLALCQTCHLDEHRVPSGDFEWDPEEAAHQRAAFDHAMNKDD